MFRDRILRPSIKFQAADVLEIEKLNLYACSFLKLPITQYLFYNAESPQTTYNLDTYLLLHKVYRNRKPRNRNYVDNRTSSSFSFPPPRQNKSAYQTKLSRGERHGTVRLERLNYGGKE